MDVITYFKQSGAANTEEVLHLAYQRYQKGDLTRIVIASTYGDTALKATQIFDKANVRFVIVGEILPEGKRPTQEVCAQMEALGHQVIWGTHLGEMSSLLVGQPVNIISSAFYRLGQGFKVACEIVLMATSQGVVEAGEKVISIGGTHRGADTALVVSAASFGEFAKFSVHEILCKPY